MSDTYEKLWNRYQMHIDLYKQYLDLTIKINIFFYGISGAIVSFYFSKDTNGTLLEYCLVLPILFGLGMAGFFRFCDNTYKVALEDIEYLREAMNLNFFIRTDGLSILFRGATFLSLVVSIGMMIIFLTNVL